MTDHLAEMTRRSQSRRAATREEYVFLTRVMGYTPARAAADVGVAESTADRWEAEIRQDPARGEWHAGPTQLQVDLLSRRAGIDPRRRRDRVPLRATR